MCSRSKSFSPIRWRHRGLKEECAGDIVEGANGAFGLSVLSGGVGAREAEPNAMCGEEGGDRGVNKFSAIVGLHSNKRPRELSVNMGDKSNECGGGVRLLAQRKSPHKVREIINDHKIVFKTGIAQNRRCPQITMD
jgi:hypothetical protein